MRGRERERESVGEREERHTWEERESNGHYQSVQVHLWYYRRGRWTMCRVVDAKEKNTNLKTATIVG
jgi:hypothetical protein